MGIIKKLGRRIAPFILAGAVSLGGCLGNTLTEPPQPINLEQRISKEISEPNCQPDKYGVIINGINETRFIADVSLIYQILLENGFKKENVYILDETGRESYFYPADDVAHKRSIETLFNYLGKKIDEEDVLVVHFSDHGESREVKSENALSKESQTLSEIVLPYGNVSEIDLERYLSNIHPKLGIISTDVCYGGGFSRRLGKGNYVGISQTTDKDLGYNDLRNSFGGFFYQSFRNSEESDKNGDGKVTIDEAFDYAKLKHHWARNEIVNPQLVSEIDVKDLSIQ